MRNLLVVFAALLGTAAVFNTVAAQSSVSKDFPQTIDLDDGQDRQVVVDREPGQYLGHPTTCLLEDGKTILCVYPKGHGKGAIIYKRSTDGGLTWSDRLSTPENWATSREVPTLHRVVGPDGTKRIIMWVRFVSRQTCRHRRRRCDMEPVETGWRLGRNRCHGVR